MVIRQATKRLVPSTYGQARTIYASPWLATRVVRTRVPVPRRKDHRAGHPQDHTSGNVEHNATAEGREPRKLQVEDQKPDSNAEIAAAASSTTTPTSSDALTASPAAQLPVIVPPDSSPLTLSTAPWAHKLRHLLAVPCIIVTRQLELLNVLAGFEQANKYQLSGADGELVGYLVEEEVGMLGGAMKRQLLGTHRPLRALVLDKDGETILVIRRPFNWINSRIFVATPSSTSKTGDDGVQEGEQIIGEAQQEWHLYRRRYNQFVRGAYAHAPASTPARSSETAVVESPGDVPSADDMEQFGAVDAGLLAWDFVVQDEAGRKIASINRNFSGLARELFTDTGQYVVRFEAVAAEEGSSDALPSPTTVGQISSPWSPSTSPNARALLTRPGNQTLPSSTPAREEEQAESLVNTPTSTSTSISTVTAEVPALTYAQRAVVLATAISADFDYFSRHSGHGGMGGGMFMPIPMGGFGGQPPAQAPDSTGEVGAGGVGEAGEGRVQGQEGDYDEGPPSPAAGEGYGAGSAPSSQSWGDENMRDPWASDAPPAQEEGGTWGWNDLFPGDDGGEQGGGGGWGGDSDW